MPYFKKRRLEWTTLRGYQRTTLAPSSGSSHVLCPLNRRWGFFQCFPCHFRLLDHKEINLKLNSTSLLKSMVRSDRNVFLGCIVVLGFIRQTSRRQKTWQSNILLWSLEDVAVTYFIKWQSNVICSLKLSLKTPPTRSIIHFHSYGKSEVFQHGSDLWSISVDWFPKTRFITSKSVEKHSLSRTLISFISSNREVRPKCIWTKTFPLVAPSVRKNTVFYLKNILICKNFQK